MWGLIWGRERRGGWVDAVIDEGGKREEGGWVDAVIDEGGKREVGGWGCV